VCIFLSRVCSNREPYGDCPMHLLLSVNSRLWNVILYGKHIQYIPATIYIYIAIFTCQLLYFFVPILSHFCAFSWHVNTPFRLRFIQIMFTAFFPVLFAQNRRPPGTCVVYTCKNNRTGSIYRNRSTTLWTGKGEVETECAGGVLCSCIYMKLTWQW